MQRHATALWALTLGNFVIGTGVLAPAGLINDLSVAFAIDVATVGTLIAYGAAVLCIEAPLLAFFTNKIDRRLLLTSALALYAAGHFASAFAPNFTVLLLARLIMVAGAAVFTPQAASTLGLILPVERRSSAIAFIFLGWSMASAVGVPVVSLLSAHLGWSAAYLVLAAACVVACLAVFVTLPSGMISPPLSVAAWQKVFTSGKLWLILCVTAISMAGQFVEYPFIAAELKSRLSASPQLIATLLAVYGVAGVVGAMISATVIGRWGAPTTASVFIAAILLGVLVWASGVTSMSLIVVALLAWGSGVGPANSAQQARLIAVDPHLASASVSLNTSAIYIGQALGTMLGAALLLRGFTHAMGIVAVALVAVALAGSLTVRHRLQA